MARPLILVSKEIAALLLNFMPCFLSEELKKSHLWFDILVYLKQIIGIISGLNLYQSIVVILIAGPDSILSFIHHEI